MTINTLVKKIAESVVADHAYAENRIIRSTSDFTEADLEEIETMRNQIFRILYNSNGRKWHDVFAEIKCVTGADSFIGFKAQDKIIATCANYGIVFEV